MTTPPRQRVEIVRYRPEHRLARRAFAAFAVLLLAIGAYGLGRWHGREAGSPGAAATQERAGACPDELEQCLQATVNLRRGAEVDAETLRLARSEVAEARARIGTLEHETALYRSLVDGSARTDGVSVHALELKADAAGGPHAYRYETTLIQRAARHAPLRGFATITVSGTQGGKAVQLGALATGAATERRGVPLEFVHFQTLTGTLALPPDFEPRQVTVRADFAGGAARRAERTFDWTLAEG